MTATVTRRQLVQAVAAQHGLSLPKAALTVSIAAAELELADATEFSARTAGELEAIAARKIKAAAK